MNESSSELAHSQPALISTTSTLANLLAPGEIVHKAGGVAPPYLKFNKYLMITILVPSALATLGVLLIFLGPLFYMRFKYLRNCAWCITDRRLITGRGLLRFQTQEIGLRRIGEVKLKQGIFSRIFNTGTLSVKDTGGSEILMPFLSNPLEVKKILGEVAYSAQQTG